jgi:hypothetical protein
MLKSMATDPFDIDPKLLVALERTARETRKSEAQILTEALEAYLVRSHPRADLRPHESFFERAHKLGLLGCIEGGPADLSTNKEHMAGFGEG